MTAPKVTGGLMVSRTVNTIEDGVRLVAETMTEPVFQDQSGVCRPLRQIAQHLLDHPDLLPPTPWAPHIRAIMQEFVDDHPRRKLRRGGIAGLVDWLLLSESPISLPDARYTVARAMGRTFAAVKLAHVKFGARRARRARRIKTARI